MEIPYFSFYKTIEESGISNWVREDPFWAILSIHAIGMAMVVGASLVVCLRLLGFPRDLPLAPLKRLYLFVNLGFWTQLISGALLLIGYPTKALTNWDFYLKILLLALAMIVTLKIKSRVFSTPDLSEKEMMLRGKTLAWAALLFWAGVVTAGRMLAYTFSNITYPG